jgi:hypothetical protein
MAYTSIFSGGQLGTVNKNLLTYKAPAPPKFNVNSVGDVPSLNKALHVGQINQQQWMQRFKQLQPKAPQIKTGLAAVPSSLGDALNQVFVQSPKAAVVDTKNAVVTQAKQFTQPVSTQAQRNAVITGQNALQKQPASVQQAVTKLGHNGVAPGAKTLISAGKQASREQPTSQIQATINKGIQQGKVNQGKALNVLANVAGIDAGGALGKLGAVKSSVGAAVGKDEATNALINSQKIATANKKVNLADKLGSSSVKDATSPKTTPISVVDKSVPVTGKVTTKADSAYIKASNRLSNQYEKELANVQTVSHPVTQKVLQDKLDTKYNAFQQNLDDTYGKSSVSFKGNPTKAVESGVVTPRSALTKNPVVPFDSTRIPEQNTNKLPSPAPPETTSPIGAKTNSGEIPAEQGAKISGSAVNSETRAVESGLVKEFPDKATYTGTSYKQDAEDAVKLANENPDKARAIASGNESGRNQAFNVAVRRAVESKASKESDVDTIMQLGNSSGHTRTSEAAQTLGAESYNTHAHSPVEAIKQIAAVRKEVGAKKLGKSAEKAISSTVKEIKSEPALQVSRQDWHSFVSDLRCK